MPEQPLGTGATLARHDAAKVSVFISYSRTDLAFALRLVDGLRARGLAPKIDSRDLPTLEDWRRELLGFIRSADAVIFIVSANSVASPTCEWEIGQVAALNKRLAPVVLERVPDDRIPVEIARINYLFFDDGEDFDAAVDKLAAALETDITWVKEHTRLGEMARRWDERKRSEVLALRGHELSEAEAWISRRPRLAPEPTALHHAFVLQSRRQAQRRNVTVAVVSLAVALVSSVLAGAAVLQWRRAVANEAEAVTAQKAEAVQRQEAEAQRKLAVEQQRLAEANEARAREQRALAEANEQRASRERDVALRTQSRFMADLARQHTARRDEGTAMALLLEAMPGTSSKPDRPLVHELVPQLFDTLARLREISYVAIDQNQGDLAESNNVLIGPDGAAIAVYSDKHGVRLWRIGDRLEFAARLPGSDGATHAALSSDGAKLATSHTSGEVVVWDVAGGHRLESLPANTERDDTEDVTFHPTYVAFSPDGRLIATAGHRVGVEVWDWKGRVKIASLAVAKGGVDEAVFDGDDRLLLITTGAQLQSWHFARQRAPRLVLQDKGALVALVRGMTGESGGMSFSADRKRVVVCGYQSNVHVLDVATGSIVWKRETEAAGTNGCRLSPDSKYLYMHTRRNAEVIDIASGVSVTIRDWDAGAEVVDFSPDSKRIATARGGGYRSSVVNVWDLESGEKVDSFAGHDTSLVSIAFVRDGTSLLTHGKDGSIRLWDTSPAREFPSLGWLEAMVAPAAISPDGRMLAEYAGQDKPHELMDATSGRRLFRLDGASRYFYPLFSGGPFVIAQEDRQKFAVWDVASERRLYGIDSVVQPVPLHDGKVLVVHKENISIVELRTGQVVKTLPCKGSDPSIAAVSSDGQLIALGYDDGIIIRSTDARVERRIEIEGRVYGIDALAFAPDGKSLFHASGALTARYEVEHGQRLAEYSPVDCRDGNRADIESECDHLGAFDVSADGKWLLAATRHDNTVRVWSADSGAQVATLVGHNGTARFSADSQALLTVGNGSVVKRTVLFPTVEALLAQAQTKAPRRLDQRQRRAFFAD
ncbi:MAG: hypothetical protein CTY20_02690 [Hyphomicrobium sp.]|nr:MAG: hypothetical protein CTY20_02690 [Hyphomicrobium sp.]